METRIVSGEELRRIAGGIIRDAANNRDPLTFMGIATIGGDRIGCCDEGIVFADDPCRGIATIAPEGEFGGDGMPTIVGVFVRQDSRHQGCATALTEAVVRRCAERRFTRVRVDVMARGALRAIEKLPAELRGILHVVDQTSLLPF